MSPPELRRGFLLLKCLQFLKQHANFLVKIECIRIASRHKEVPLMIRRFLYNFFQGRNGFDPIAKLTVALALAAALLTLFGGWVGLVFDLAAMALMVYTWWRVLSRNIYKRQEEVRRYLDRTSGLRQYFRNLRTRFSQRREYKFFTCPTCHTMLRVPRGKGKIQITCRKCGNRFSGKT